MPQQTARLNLTLPDTGNKTWETDVENWAHKLDESSAQYLCLHLGGQAIDEEIIFDGFHFDEAVNISGVTLFARVAPAGSDFVLDFLKNQVEQSQIVSLPAGSPSGSGSVTGLSYAPLDDRTGSGDQSAHSLSHSAHCLGDAMKRLFWGAVLLILLVVPVVADAIKYKGDLESNESLLLPSLGASPGNPGGSKWKLYFKEDGLFQLNESGDEKHLTTRAVGQNFVINPEGLLGQRGVSFTSTTTPDNSNWNNFLDRWTILAEGVDAADYSRETGIVPALSKGSIKIEAAAGGLQFGMFQAIEEKDTALFRAGGAMLTFQARTVGTEIAHLKAALLCWTGAADAVTDPIAGWGQDDGPMSWAVNHSLQGITVPLPLSENFQAFGLVSFVSPTCQNLEVLFWVDDGTLTSGDEVFISQVQLEKGDTPTEYSPRPFGMEVLLAQRFYSKTYDLDAAPGTSTSSGALSVGLFGVTNTTHTHRTSWRFPHTMRAAPNINFYNLSGSSGVWDVLNGSPQAPFVISIGERGALFEVGIPASVDSRVEGHLTADAEIQGN
jgi:hypothetical protein